MHYLITLLLLAVLNNAIALEVNSGDEKLTLVELYTSEGCSSCPPADRWISKFLDDPKLWTKIIPLSFHVDYWNYLGWADKFADQRFSERQRTHKREGNVNSVYTPGIIVDGKEWRGYFVDQPIPHAHRDKPGNMRLKLKKNQASVEFDNNQATLVAHLVFLGTGIESHVKRGENANRTLNHNFVVLSYQRATSRDGRWEFDVRRTSASTAVAAWVSTTENQAPIQAVGGWLKGRSD